MDDLITNRGKIVLSFDGLLFVSIMIHVILCPFTKVEESFNMQAIHDLLMLTTTNVHAFDHLKFPGVVPRSFLGALAISFGGMLFKSVWESYNYESKIALLYASRMVLGYISYLSFGCMRRAASNALLFSDLHVDAKHVCDVEASTHKVSRKYFLIKDKFERIFNLLIAVSFHLPFYMSRTLPNTYALIGNMLAMSLWLRRLPLQSLFVIAIVMVIFRCDMLILLGTMALQMLMFGEIPFWRSLGLGLCVSLAALALTVVVDSFFWRAYYANQYTFLWPEGIVLFFNTVQNKSSEWGTSPWYWYWLVALPKALHLYLPLIFCGLLNIHAQGNIINYMLDYNVKMKKYVRDQAVTISRHGRWPILGFLCIGTVTTVTHYPAPPPPLPLPSLTEGESKNKDEELEAPSEEGEKRAVPAADIVTATVPVVVTTASLFNLPLLYYLFPSISFIILYSWLPHKELRFIMPVLPTFIMAASVGLVQLLPYATLPLRDNTLRTTTTTATALTASSIGITSATPHSHGSKYSSPRSGVGTSPRITRVCIDTIDLDAGIEGLDSDTRRLIADNLRSSVGAASLSRQSSSGSIARTNSRIQCTTGTPQISSNRKQRATRGGSISPSPRPSATASTSSSCRSSPTSKNVRKSIYRELAAAEAEMAAEKAKLQASLPKPVLDTSVVHLAEDDTINTPLHEIFTLGEEEDDKNDKNEDELYSDCERSDSELDEEAETETSEAKLKELILEYALPHKSVSSSNSSDTTTTTTSTTITTTGSFSAGVSGDICRHDEKTNTLYIFKKPTPINVDTERTATISELEISSEVSEEMFHSSGSSGSSGDACKSIKGKKSELRHVRCFILLRWILMCCLLAGTLLITYVFTAASVYNYPGGYAVLKLEDHVARRGLERKLQEMSTAPPFNMANQEYRKLTPKQVADINRLKERQEAPLQGYMLLASTYAKFLYRPKKYLQYVFQDTHLFPGLLGRDSWNKTLAPVNYATSLVTNALTTTIGSSDKARHVDIHLSADACMTGITRFLERPRLITLNNNNSVLVVHDLHYSKEEKLVAAQGDFDRYDFIVTADVSSFISNDDDRGGHWELLDCIDGFSGYAINPNLRKLAATALQSVYQKLLALITDSSDPAVTASISLSTSSNTGLDTCTQQGSCINTDTVLDTPKSLLAQCTRGRQVSVLPGLLFLKLEAKLYLLANANR